MSKHEFINQLKLNADGLIPAVAQQYDSKEVLMMAWMSREAIEKTLETGDVHYWSRSRNALWKKGETSSNTQKLREIRVDCDGDTLLLLIDQTGPACHTKRPSCFYSRVDEDGLTILTEPVK